MANDDPKRDSKLGFKLLAANEGDLLCEGIERVYGQTYPIGEFYDPAYLRKQIAGGKLHCVVGVDTAGSVQACMSTVLESLQDFTADGSALLVAPQCRGQGVVAQLGEQMLATYRRLGLVGLHLYALGLHDLVQKQSGAAGAVVTGILPAWFSRRAKVAGYDYPDVRIGAVCLYMPLEEAPHRTVYLPRRYEHVLSEIYKLAPVSRHCLAAPESVILPQESVLACEEKPGNQQRRLVVARVGQNLAEKITAQLTILAAQNDEVIYLDIPLSDPAVNHAVSVACEYGFFFGALMLERNATDRLRMQCYSKKLAAPSHIVVASEQARELLAYVLEDQQSVCEI